MSGLLEQLDPEEQRVLVDFARSKSKSVVGRRAVLKAGGVIGAGALLGSGGNYGTAEASACDPTDFDGASLADRIQAAYDDGQSGVRVEKANSYDWHTNVTIPPGGFLIFDDPRQLLNFEGASGAGDSNVALSLSSDCVVRGGVFVSSRTSWNADDEWTAVGLANGQVKNAYAAIPKINKFERAIDIRADGATSHNRVFCGFARDCRKSTIIRTDGGNFASENHVGPYRTAVTKSFSDGSEIGVEFDANGGQIIENVIPDPSLNGSRSGTAIRGRTGSGGAVGNNRMFNLRTENWSSFFDWGANCSDLHVFGWNRNWGPGGGVNEIDDVPDNVFIHGGTNPAPKAAQFRWMPNRLLDGSTTTLTHLINENRFGLGREAQVTKDVGTDATTIYTPTIQGTGSVAMVLVTGRDSRVNTFVDLVLMATAGGTTTVASQTRSTPANRDYRLANQKELQLSMDSGRYNIVATALNLISMPA